MEPKALYFVKLKYDSNPIHRKIIAKSDKEQTYIPHVRGNLSVDFIKEMKVSKFVYHSHDNAFYFNGIIRRRLFGYEPFRMSKNPILGNNPYQGPLIGKNLPFGRAVQMINLRMLSGGINGKLLQDFFPMKTNNDNMNDEAKPINISHLAAPLCGLALAHFISALVLILEHFHSKNGILYK